MEEQKYHPQQDVFRLINGEKSPVQPYRFGQGEKPAPRTPHPYIKEIVFDGHTLTTTAVIGKDKEITQRLPAVSGAPRFGDEFDYSNYRQQSVGGPIPEGNYFVNPQLVQRPTIKDDIFSAAGSVAGKTMGKYPGGRYAWGDCRLPIEKTPEQNEKTGRDNFFIHGGKEAGSGGCIDLTDKDKIFCEFIEKYRGKEQEKIPLKVKYSDDDKDVKE